MKTCLVSDHLVGCHSSWSGAELVCKYFSDIFAKNNFQQVFITTEFEGNKKNILQLPLAKGGKIKKIFLKPILRIAGIFSCYWFLKKQKPDVMHFFHSNYLSIPALVSARLLGIPVIFTVLDYFIICPKDNLFSSNETICHQKEGARCFKCVKAGKVLEKMAINFLLKKADKIITFTQTSKKRLESRGIDPEKIEIIYAFNAPSFSAPEKEDENSVLFLGTFFKYKGLHIAVKAMPKVILEFPQAKLKIGGLGSPQDKERIESLVKELGIGKNVEFLGQKKNQDALRLISESEVVVVPEQWPSDFGPLILVEAMALQKPIVAGNVGAIPEFIEDKKTGLLAEYNNPDDFAEKIIHMLKDKSQAKGMAFSARIKIENFMKQDREKQILQLYGKI